jgi:hypothetical protein
MSYPVWATASGPVRCCGCHQPIPPGSDVFIKSKGVYYCGTCGPLAEATAGDIKAGGIEEAFILDLGKFPDEAADTALAKQSCMMARQLDCGEVAPREITQYTKEIRLNLLQLIELYPPEGEPDDTEDRRNRMQERRRREQGGI